MVKTTDSTLRLLAAFMVVAWAMAMLSAPEVGAAPAKRPPPKSKPPPKLLKPPPPPSCEACYIYKLNAPKEIKYDTKLVGAVCTDALKKTTSLINSAIKRGGISSKSFTYDSSKCKSGIGRICGKYVDGSGAFTGFLKQVTIAWIDTATAASCMDPVIDSDWAQVLFTIEQKTVSGICRPLPKQELNCLLRPIMAPPSPTEGN